MTRQPRATGRAVRAALERGGFHLSHVRGSHHYLLRPDRSRLVAVPVHGNRVLPAGTMQSILRQAGLTGDELQELL